MAKGRPSKFNDSIREIMLRLYSKGKTDDQVAEIIGVSARTINNWKVKHSDFLQSLKGARAIADDLVEASLFSRAVGYSHQSEQIFCFRGRVTRVPFIKHHPPDVTAQIFWLKNRRPNLWRDAHVIENESPDEDKNTIKRTFAEFCIKAGYPAPYPKQLEMMDFAFSHEEPRLLLGARGTGKTDYITVLGDAYGIYDIWYEHIHNGVELDETNLIISKSKTRNTAMIGEIAEALEKNGVELDKKNSNCVRIKGLIGKDHSAEVVTIKTSLRGRHPKRTLMDDPVTEEDVSEAMRTLVKRKYNEVLKLTDNVCVIGQPAHLYDLYAELRPIVKKMEVPWGTIPELDHDLDVQRAAGVDEKSIKASYFLEIDPEGDATFHDIERIEKFPNQESIAFLDPSDGGDTSALGIFTGHFQGMAIVGHAWKKRWDLCIPDIKKLCKEYRIHKLIFEVNKFGLMPLDVLRQELHELGVSVEGKYTHSNKEVRIRLAAQYSKHLFLSKQSNPEYTRQVIQYGPGAKFDDAPDTIATFLEYAGRIRPPKSTKKPSGDL